MVKGKIKLISESILREVQRKKQFLEGFPNSDLLFSNGKKKIFRKEANRHSVSLELELYNTKTASGRRAKAKEYKLSFDNLQKAMDWGLDNYGGELTKDFVVNIGRIIDPRVNWGIYRNERVRIVGAESQPPSSEKVEREMLHFLYDNSCIDSSLERAAHAHFHIARIHPFIDGNGRTARAVQNLILEKEGYFPLTIKPSEKGEYVHLLDNASGSYKVAEAELAEKAALDSQILERVPFEDYHGAKNEGYLRSLALGILKVKMTSEQNDFYNFIALKVRDSLSSALDVAYNSSKRK